LISSGQAHNIASIMIEVIPLTQGRLLRRIAITGAPPKRPCTRPDTDADL
jgi:hypothetical protein